jgi:DNA-binding MarR family transcriptional regulator
MSRTESGVLATLADNGPQRISSLADIEGLAQPTVTLLVRRLEDRGWVERQRFAKDGRVVLVSLTQPGRDALEAVRSHYRTLVRDALDTLTADQVEALRRASGALEALMDALQREDQP